MNLKINVAELGDSIMHILARSFPLGRHSFKGMKFESSVLPVCNALSVSNDLIFTMVSSGSNSSCLKEEDV